MTSRGAARAFDRGKLLFSEKLTAVNMNAYLAVQRVSPATLLVAGSVWEALLSAVGRLIFSSTEFGHHVTLTSSRKPCIHKVEKSQS